MVSVCRARAQGGDVARAAEAHAGVHVGADVEVEPELAAVDEGQGEVLGDLDARAEGRVGDAA